jgi:hypothetical protein
VNTFQQLCAAVLLCLSLTIPAFAGEMQTPGKSDSDNTQTTPTIAGPVLELSLGLLLNVSSLF